MKILTTLDAMKKVVANVRPFFSMQVPYLSLIVDEGVCWALASDNFAVVTAIQLSEVTEIEEDGEALNIPGALLESTLKNMIGTSFALRTTETAAIIEDQHGLRTRLQFGTKGVESGAFQKFSESRQNPALTSTVTVLYEDVQRLVNLSRAFPAFSANGLRWAVIQWNEQGAFGFVQESEMGSVENMPLTCEGLGGEGRVSFRSDLLGDILRMSGTWCNFRVGDTVRSPVVVTDPEDPSWWTISSQFALPGELKK